MNGTDSFYSNTGCAYFPCHKGIEPENFNCLFCYCPLYALGRECGGNYKYSESGVKICTDCNFVHKKENYEEVLKKVRLLVKRLAEIEKQN